MSLILEALKKSEKERQQKSGSGDATAAPEDDGRTGSRPRWQWMAVLAALPVLAFVLGGGIGFFRLVPVPQPAADAPRPLATAAPVTPAARQAASAAPIVTAPAHKEPVATAAPPAPPEPAAPTPTPAPKAVAQPVAPAAPAPAPAVAQAEPPAAAPGRLAAVAVPKKPAVPAATAAASLRPPASGDAQALTRKGRAFEDKGLYEQAIDAYSQAIVVDPGFADAYFGRGWSRVATGAYGDAARDFASVVALRPDSADAYFGRAWALEQQGDAEQAIRLYGEAIRLQPGHAEAYFSRGVLEFTAGRMEAAARDFAAVHENAVGGLGDYARLWRHVAEARAGGGASATALIGWQGKGPWPEVLAKLFKGEATPEQVLADARSENAKKQRENECIAFFFLAQHRLVNGDLNGAVGYFRRTLATGVTHFRQYAAARAELGRLGKAN